MYNRLYDAWRKERLESKELQPLDPSFFSDLSQYIKKMHEELRMLDEKTLKYRLLNMELEKARQLASSVMDARFKKLMAMLLGNHSMEQEHFTDEEAELFRRVLQVVEQHENFKKRVVEGRSIDLTIRPAQETGKILVRLTASVPKIVGVDMRVYGPFDPEDVATLPRENAEALIRQKAAVKIEAEY